VLKAQVELSKLVDRLITLNQRRQIVEVRLNTLLNRPIHIHVGKPEEFELHELVYTIDELYKLALHNNPELKAAYTSIEKAKTAYDLAKKHYYPDFMITAKYMDSKMDNGSWAIMGSVNVPLWYKKKQDYQVKEAQSILEAFEAAYEAKKNMVLFKIKDLLVKLQTLKRLVNLYKTSILPQAEQSLKASEIGYKTEKVDFLNLLDSQRMLFSFKLEYYRTIVNFKKYLAELEQTVGVELTKEGGRE
jgi:outer membrane protein TolC